MRKEDFLSVIGSMKADNFGHIPNAIRVSMRNQEIYSGRWDFVSEEATVIYIMSFLDGKRRKVFISLAAIATIGEA